MSDINDIQYIRTEDSQNPQYGDSDWMTVRRNMFNDIYGRLTDRNSREYKISIGVVYVNFLYTISVAVTSLSQKCSGAYNMNSVYFYFLLYTFLKYLSLQYDYTIRNMRRIIFSREICYIMTNISLIDSIYRFYYKKDPYVKICNNLSIVNIVYYSVYLYLPTLVLLFVLCFFLPRAIRMQRNRNIKITVDMIDKHIPEVRCTGEHSGKNCTICLEDFSIGDHIRILPCNHIYHKDCIDEWIMKENNCPICRKEVISELNNLDIV